MSDAERILVVDDDSSCRDVVRESLQALGYRCEAAADGAEALARLRDLPFDLVLSDIDMPCLDGVSLLREIKSLDPDTEVVLLTGLHDLEVALRSMRLGATDYLTKPFRLEQVRQVVERSLEKRRLTLAERGRRRALEARLVEGSAALSRSTRQVEGLFRRLQESYQTTLEAFATALDARDAETLGHSMRVGTFTVEVARRMGIGEPTLTDFYRGALLHDVGKIGVPDSILRKPGRLTAAEWSEMRKHPEIGARMLEGIRFLERSLPIVRSHQERFDGRGYPDGLRGESIPMGARVFAVVDTLDAMTSDRPYRRALPYARAREEIVRFAGTQFDPKVVTAFLEISEEEWRELERRVLAELASQPPDAG